ncbi:MAG: 50S ribosomal protein L6, partial [Bdellovibrionota bacterium]
YPIPEGIEVKVDKQTNITITGASKELVGQVAAKVRGFRPPEPYLGKGVKYSDEKLRRKEGKSAGK